MSLFSDPTTFVILAIVLVVSLTFHEFAHAWTADKLGDSTPRRFGRLTLNPLAHLDPFGTLLMIFAHFGFAKPVPINMNAVGRWGGLLVAAAGPLSNLLLAGISIALLRALHTESVTTQLLIQMIATNVTLAVFNLLPIPLLDGSRIIAALFPPLGRSLQQYEQGPYGFLITMGFILVMQQPIGVFLRRILNWVAQTFLV